MTEKVQGHILIVDDNQDVLIASQLLLKHHFETVLCCHEPEDIERYITQYKIDLVVLDMNFRQDAISGQEGFYWLSQINQRFPHVVVVMMTAYAEISLAVESIKKGASDFIAKPWQNDELLAAIASAFKHVEARRALNQVTRKRDGLAQIIQQMDQPIIGQSQTMQAVFSTIEKAAKTDANILISGESGTGKELIARAIHQASPRADNAFISLDMGAIASNLFESELFGHKKGSFTDARQDRVGRFELAEGGSLFLDEMANLPLTQQAKLLVAIQNRQITPLGANQPVDVNIRLICASNENLQQSVEQGTFRQDLLYRINTIEVHLPPLRERKDDIPLILEHYLRVFNQKYKRELGIAQADVRDLTEYAWPGNIRELAHATERAVILSDGHILDVSSILTPSTGTSEQHSETQSTEHKSSSDFLLSAVEKQTIAEALVFFDGNISHAANALGLTRGALYRRLDKYGLGNE